MPGVPVNGQDVNTFFISFWASLYSGIIYSILTGITVGLTVWLLQKKLEKNMVQGRYERELAEFREKLRIACQQQDSSNIFNIARTVPSSILEAIKTISENPIDLWLCNYPKEGKLLNQLKELQKIYSKYIVAANNLNFKLSAFIRLHNVENEIPLINDSTDINYYFSRINNFSVSDIIPWLDMSSSHWEGAIKRLEGSYIKASSDINIKELTERYLEVRKEMYTEFDKMKMDLL